ncbi:hypothetical protein PSTG_09313 [Puccinia striiformis f. sp. tritici PST-78]|uniref:Uncharacterized protein n=1 Tax=Puccinia striiformis f. sp. tritici PST-78 TaxID=1165861 RepID=A0A0L0VE82_9BASI|nr:hypothetical protein PSTG_09313 [Puccinia striiformis f. sp. tritici PST-78]
MRLNLILLQISLHLLHGWDISGVAAMEPYQDIYALSVANEVQHTRPSTEEISPVGKFLLENHSDKDAKRLLKSSEQRFNALGDQITRSVEKGNLVYIDDGEGDDQWQSLLGALNEIVPEMVVSRGGYYLVRQDLTNRVWDRFHQVAGKDKPKIMPIHGTLDRFGVFDNIEGLPIYEGKELEELREASTDEVRLAAAVKETKEELRERLRTNEFTTIVAKCAPTGLAELIVEAEAQDRVAIVWTGFMRFDPKSRTFQVKFNVRKDLQASQALLDLKLPTVITTPRLQNAELAAIVAREITRVFAPLSDDISNDYKGFEKLHYLHNLPKWSWAYSLTKHHDYFRDHRIDEFLKDSKRLRDLKEKRDNEVEMSQSELDELNKLDASMSWSQGGKWHDAINKIKLERADAIEKGDKDRMIPEGAPFRDFCPIDQYAHVILKDSLRKQSVKEVVAANVKLTPDNQLFEFTASPSANMFIVTKFDTNYLRDEIQNSLYWMFEGEPLDRQAYLNILKYYQQQLLESKEKEVSSSL